MDQPVPEAAASSLRRNDGWLLEQTRRGHIRLTRGLQSVGVDLRRGQIESLRVGDREVLSSPLTLSLRSAERRELDREDRARGSVRVRRTRVTQSAEDIEIVLELRSRVAAATVTLRADARDGILVHAQVRPRRDALLVGFRAGLDSALDRVQWARRASPAADRPERLGWHRRTLAQLRSTIGRDAERGGVEQVQLADGDVQVRVAREGATPFRFAFPSASASARSRARSRRELMRAPETTLAVVLESGDQDPAPTHEYSARFRLTWGATGATGAAGGTALAV